MIQTKLYTFDNLSHTRKQVKRAEHCTTFFFFSKFQAIKSDLYDEWQTTFFFFSKFHAIKSDLYDEWQTCPFWIFFKVDTVGAAHATEDPHNICLSEPLVQIMKFPTLVIRKPV